MPKSVLLYIATALLLVQLFSLSNETVNLSLNIFSFAAILTIGVAHGSIDHVLFNNKRNISQSVFILIYLLTLLANVALWLLLPEFALLFFLVFSAYHFGQSQFVELKIPRKWLSKILYFSWGAAILSGLIYFNRQEINELFFDSISSSTTFQLLLAESGTLLILFSAIFLITSLVLRKLQYVSTQNLALEMVQIILILASFYLFPVIIGFSLYFIILHSFRVLLQEYDYLKESAKIKSILQFVKLLLPFTLLSSVGLGLMVMAVYFFKIQLNLPVQLLILTSAITLPHVLVMEYFYSSK
ncbi:MAG: Brp/Blh family beta-carotene 15,15'-dioxygenase [Vicingaceae bacterium]